MQRGLEHLYPFFTVKPNQLFSEHYHINIEIDGDVSVILEKLWIARINGAFIWNIIKLLKVYAFIIEKGYKAKSKNDQ